MKGDAKQDKPFRVLCAFFVLLLLLMVLWRSEGSVTTTPGDSDAKTRSHPSMPQGLESESVPVPRIAEECTSGRAASDGGVTIRGVAQELWTSAPVAGAAIEVSLDNGQVFVTESDGLGQFTITTDAIAEVVAVRGTHECYSESSGTQNMGEESHEVSVIVTFRPRVAFVLPEMVGDASVAEARLKQARSPWQRSRKIALDLHEMTARLMPREPVNEWPPATQVGKSGSLYVYTNCNSGPILEELPCYVEAYGVNSSTHYYYLSPGASGRIVLDTPIAVRRSGVLRIEPSSHAEGDAAVHYYIVGMDAAGNLGSELVVRQGELMPGRSAEHVLPPATYHVTLSSVLTATDVVSIDVQAGKLTIMNVELLPRAQTPFSMSLCGDNPDTARMGEMPPLLCLYSALDLASPPLEVLVCRPRVAFGECFEVPVRTVDLCVPVSMQLVPYNECNSYTLTPGALAPKAALDRRGALPETIHLKRKSTVIVSGVSRNNGTQLETFAICWNPRSGIVAGEDSRPAVDHHLPEDALDATLLWAPSYVPQRVGHRGAAARIVQELEEGSGVALMLQSAFVPYSLRRFTGVLGVSRWPLPGIEVCYDGQSARSDAQGLVVLKLNDRVEVIECVSSAWIPMGINRVLRSSVAPVFAVQFGTSGP